MVQYSPYAIAEDKTPDWKPGEELAAAAFIGISISLIFDVNVGIWRAFRKSQGLYYWSMKLGTIACLVDAIGVILKYLTPRPYHVWGLYTACLLIGWSVYAPAQLLVLYSRLHLVNDSRKTQRWVLVMIMSTIFFLIIPTWVVVWVIVLQLWSGKRLSRISQHTIPIPRSLPYGHRATPSLRGICSSEDGPIEIRGTNRWLGTIR